MSLCSKNNAFGASVLNNAKLKVTTPHNITLFNSSHESQKRKCFYEITEIENVEDEDPEQNKKQHELRNNPFFCYATNSSAIVSPRSLTTYTNFFKKAHFRAHKTKQHIIFQVFII